MTVQDWGKEWLECYKEGRVEYKTYTEYQRIMFNLIGKAFKDVELDQVTPRSCQRFINSINGSASRIKKTSFLLRSMLEDAIDNDLIDKNPARKIKRTQETIHRKKVFTKEQYNAIMLSVDRFSWIARLLLLTGIRRSEAVALKWSDIDQERKLLHISRASVLRKGGEVVRDCTKTKRDRLIPLSDQLLDELMMHKESSNWVLVNEGTPGRGSANVGERMSSHALSNRVDAFYHRLGFENVTGVHRFRHSFASRLLDTGSDIRTVQILLGHSNIKTTEGYTDPNEETLRKSIENQMKN